MNLTDPTTIPVQEDEAAGRRLAGVRGWTHAELEAQIERILSSPQFRTTAVLKSFLTFITEQTIAGKAEVLTENRIAMEVFSRGPAFDSSIDTIVRTQAYRLRLKLREYYSTAGKQDPILIQVPKGHYIPQFSCNPPEVQKVGSEHPDIRGASGPLSLGSVAAGSGARGSRIAILVLSFFGVFGIGLFAGKHLPDATPSQVTQKSANSVDSFWSNFVGSDPQPIVAYTNAVYLATKDGTLLRFQSGPESDRGASVNPAVARQNLANRAYLKAGETTYFLNDLTGIGEVAGVAAVAQALNRVGAHPVFKRSKQISSDDLLNHNTVFLGSPFVHLILNDLPRPQNFLFTLPASGPLLWTARIVNSRPQPGEAAFYSIERAPGTQAIHAEHAVVSMLPGLQPGRKILILAGLTTSGTQAAAQFVTSMEGIQEMKRRLPHQKPSDTEPWPASFEDLLRIRLNRGVDVVSAECIASR